MEVSTMFQQCFKGMSRKSHENFTGIMKSVLRVIQGSINSVS